MNELIKSINFELTVWTFNAVCVVLVPALWIALLIRRIRNRRLAEQAPPVIDQRKTPDQLAAELEAHRAAELQSEIRESLRQEHDDPEDQRKLSQAYEEALSEGNTSDASDTRITLPTISGGAGGCTSGGGAVTITGGTTGSSGVGEQVTLVSRAQGWTQVSGKPVSVEPPQGMKLVPLPTPGIVAGRPRKNPLYFTLLKKEGRTECRTDTGECTKGSVALPREYQREVGAVFSYLAPVGTKLVEIAGDWNNWQPEPMQPQPKWRAMEHGVDLECWWLDLPKLPRERAYHYKFVVDGKWIADPKNPPETTEASSALNPHGNSICVALSPKPLPERYKTAYYGGDVLKQSRCIYHGCAGLPQSGHFYWYGLSVVPDRGQDQKLLDAAWNEGRVSFQFAQTDLLDLPMRACMTEQTERPQRDVTLEGRPVAIEALQNFAVKLQDLPQEGDLRFQVILWGVLVLGVTG